MATNPTLLYGYGGFDISMLPNYSAGLGAAWLDVAASTSWPISGVGASWPQMALCRPQRAPPASLRRFYRRRRGPRRAQTHFPGPSRDSRRFQRRIAHGRDAHATARFIQSRRLPGPSVGHARFNKLLAGASWMDEYGNPDHPEDWAYISKYSPYQNVSKVKHIPKCSSRLNPRRSRSSRSRP